MPTYGPDKFATQLLRLALWIFGLMMLSLVFGSMLFGLYGDPPRMELLGREVPYSHRWCVGALARLQVELEEQAVATLQQPSRRAERAAQWHAWYGEWGERLGATGALCAPKTAQPVGRAFARLQQMAQSYDQALQTLMQGCDPIRDELQDTIRKFSE